MLNYNHLAGLSIDSLGRGACGCFLPAAHKRVLGGKQTVENRTKILLNI
jgi:hypothetical protein